MGAQSSNQSSMSMQDTKKGRGTRVIKKQKRKFVLFLLQVIHVFSKFYVAPSVPVVICSSVLTALLNRPLTEPPRGPGQPPSRAISEHHRDQPPSLTVIHHCNCHPIRDIPNQVKNVVRWDFVMFIAYFDFIAISIRRCVNIVIFKNLLNIRELGYFPNFITCYDCQSDLIPDIQCTIKQKIINIISRLRYDLRLCGKLAIVILMHEI